MSVSEWVAEFNHYLLAGDFLAAFDRFFSEDVVMRENGGRPRKGKALNRTSVREFAASIIQFHGAETRTVIVQGFQVVVEWCFCHLCQ